MKKLMLPKIGWSPGRNLFDQLEANYDLGVQFEHLSARDIGAHLGAATAGGRRTERRLRATVGPAQALAGPMDCCMQRVGAIPLALELGGTDWRTTVMVSATAFMLARAGDMLDDH